MHGIARLDDIGGMLDGLPGFKLRSLIGIIRLRMTLVNV